MSESAGFVPVLMQTRTSCKPTANRLLQAVRKRQAAYQQHLRRSGCIKSTVLPKRRIRIFEATRPPCLHQQDSHLGQDE